MFTKTRRNVGLRNAGFWACALVVSLSFSSPAAGEPGSCLDRGPSKSEGVATSICLSCHDGVLASGVTTSPVGKGPRSARSVWVQCGGGHPVDIGYLSASPRQPKRLRPVKNLDERVRLWKGQVTCTSCHDLQSGEKHALAIPVRQRGSLCLSCHDM